MSQRDIIQEPRERGLDVETFGRRRQRRSCDHHDRDLQLTRRMDLGMCRLTARVLADDNVNTLRPHERQLVVETKWSSAQDQLGIRWQTILLRRVDRTDEIAMLGCRPEGRDLGSSNSEKHSPRLWSKRCHRSIRVGHLAPVITRRSHPSRTLQPQQRHVQRVGSNYGICRNARGVGMGRVDDCFDHLTAHPIDEAFGAPKASDARGAAGQQRRLGASRQRVGRREPAVARQGLGQRVTLRCASEYEDAHGNP
jgi:hypothetical protein